MPDTYQGYTNEETWVVSLWLSNTQSAYNKMISVLENSDLDTKGKALAIRYMVLETVNAQSGMTLDSRGERWGVGIREDLKGHGLQVLPALNRVNWVEIVENEQEAIA